MYKYFLVIISSMCLHTLSMAQQEKKAGKWALTFTPALIPIKGMHFGIQPGFEYLLNKRISLLTELTFQTGKNRHSDSSELNKKYFRIKPEIRYLFSGGKRNFYIALQGVYTFRKYITAKHGFYYDNLGHDSVYYFDYAKVNSPIITTSFQFGMIINSSKKVSVDLFMGFGARFINTQYSQVVNPRPMPRHRAKEWYGATGADQIIGPVTRFHMNTGIRIIYKPVLE